MNKHEEEARRYEKLKKELCKKCDGDRKLYVSSKAKYISSVIRKIRIEEALNIVSSDEKIIR